tara:strand:+ start:2470 stop:2787 length:318 start_codon:yes stop_codon:yes gene_type:complete
MGLLNPVYAASLVSFTLNELVSYSEIRANYSFFIALGILSFFSIYNQKLLKITYSILILVCGSYAFGRVVSFFMDGYPSKLIVIIVSVELFGFLLAFWRLRSLIK